MNIKKLSHIELALRGGFQGKRFTATQSADREAFALSWAHKQPALALAQLIEYGDGLRTLEGRSVV